MRVAQSGPRFARHENVKSRRPSDRRKTAPPAMRDSADRRQILPLVKRFHGVCVDVTGNWNWMETIVPTTLPKPRPAPRKRSAGNIVFNTLMLVSALALTFVVLVQEERAATMQGPLFEFAAHATATGPVDATHDWKH